MAENKTKQTNVNVDDFLKGVTDERKRMDSYRLIELMSEITGEGPKMWGPSIIGFGTYHYKYASGHEGDFMLVGFSPRKQSISVYLMAGFNSSVDPRIEKMLSGLGKFKMGKSCLYINKLDDVNIEELKELIKRSVNFLRENYLT